MTVMGPLRIRLLCNYYSGNTGLASEDVTNRIVFEGRMFDRYLAAPLETHFRSDCITFHSQNPKTFFSFY
jgi:hypothetical protein